MSYSVFVVFMQSSGLVLIGGAAVALLRLIAVHYVQRHWAPAALQSLHIVTSTMAVGLLLLAFSGGGLMATRLFETNDLPPLQALGAQSVLLTILAASVIFLHVVARPWLVDVAREPLSARPLVLDVSAHRSLAISLSLAALSSAWTLWLVLALSATPPAASTTLAALALMTLVFWLMFAGPALVLRGLAVHAMRGPESAPAPPVRLMPTIPDVPEHRHAHVPAPRAPRPRLALQRDDFNG